MSRKAREDDEPAEVHNLPPQADTAERKALSAAMGQPSTLVELLDMVSPGDFYRPTRGQLLELMRELNGRGSAIGQDALDEALERRGGPTMAAAREDLDEIARALGHPMDLAHWAALIRDAAQRRKLLAAGQALTADCHAGELRKLTSAARETLDVVDLEGADHDAEGTDDVAERVLLAFERKIEHGSLGLLTGLADLDTITGGMQPGDLVLLAARPSVGKSALALTIALDIGLKRRIPLLFVSIEMGEQPIFNRALAHISRESASAIRDGKAPYEPVFRATADLIAAPHMRWDFEPRTSVHRVAAVARRAVRSHGIKLIVIDYLQILPLGRECESRQVEVMRVSGEIKALARELQVPILALSQLSRESAKQGRPPELTDLRETGALEQDADQVWMLHRKIRDRDDDRRRDDDDEEPEDPRVAELFVRKHRNGSTGSCKLTYIEHRTMFVSYADDP